MGSVMSSLLPRKPAGAVIVLTAGVIFGLSMFLAPSRGVLAAIYRRVRLRLQIAADHLLEVAYHVLDGEERGVLTSAEIEPLAKKRAWGGVLRIAMRWHLWRLGLGKFSGGLKGGGFKPSEKGMRRGRRVSRNHRLWEQYLVTYAEIAPSHVDLTVDQVEHVLSDKVIEELEILLDADSELPADHRGLGRAVKMVGGGL